MKGSRRSAVQGLRLGRSVGCVLVLLCGLAMTGCSPPPYSVTGVFLDGEYPTVIVHPCESAWVTGITLMENSADSTPTATTSYGGAWRVADVEGKNPANEVRLLVMPEHWILQNRPIDLLTGFAADRVYFVSAETSRTGYDTGIDFTLADLNALAEGEVWARPGLFEDPTFMPREEFAHVAEESC